MSNTIIPARGTVEFIVYSLRDDDHPDYPGIEVDGPDKWSRPVVGLIESPDYVHCLGPEQIAIERTHAWSRYLRYRPVVVDECGLLFEVYDYIESVMGEAHSDCCSHFYCPHIDGPVSDAPRIRELATA